MLSGGDVFLSFRLSYWTLLVSLYIWKRDIVTSKEQMTRLSECNGSGSGVDSVLRDSLIGSLAWAQPLSMCIFFPVVLKKVACQGWWGPAQPETPRCLENAQQEKQSQGVVTQTDPGYSVRCTSQRHGPWKSTSPFSGLSSTMWVIRAVLRGYWKAKRKATYRMYRSVLSKNVKPWPHVAAEHLELCQCN